MAIPKDHLESLYLSGKSMTDIAMSLDCSVNTVVYWMNVHGIKRRTWSEASYVKLNPNGDPFLIKRGLSYRDMFLNGAGLGIYLGEGDKRSKGQVRVTNTDPATIRIFMNFLLKICQVKREKLLFSLICFNDCNPDEARRYWAKQLAVKEEKFGKIVQIPPQGKGTYNRKSQFGVCTVSVSNVKLKSWIMNETQKVREELGQI